MPVGELLILMRAAEDGLLREMRPDEMQANGQVINEAARNRDARQAGKIRADRIDVVEVHRNRVVGLVTQFECGRWHRWPRDNIDIFKCFFEIITDQLSDLLCLEVVSIVVAGRKDIRTGHDSPLDLCTKAFAATATIQVHEVLGVGGAMAETHTVEA